MQENQMTTIPDQNVHCIAVDKDFDEAQDIVKASFKDIKFRNETSLGAVNSINFARILAQIVYYFYSYYRVKERNELKPINFSVPTGNFGDILAGNIYIYIYWMHIGSYMYAYVFRFLCQENRAPYQRLYSSHQRERYTSSILYKGVYIYIYIYVQS